MLGKELLAYVDHTLLRPTATWDDIKEVIDYIRSVKKDMKNSY